MRKLDALWNYQQAVLEKDQLDAEIRNTPARVKLNKLHVFLTEQTRELNQLQNNIDQNSNMIEKLTEQVEKCEKRAGLETSEFEHMQKDDECTADEMKECRTDIETLLSDISALQTELVALITRLEQSSLAYKQTRAKAVKAKKEYDSLRVVCEEELASKADAMKECDAVIEAKAREVAPAFLSRFQEIRKTHPVPMAKVEHSQCGGCNMSLPMVVVKRVAANDIIVECENCGRILYTE